MPASMLLAALATDLRATPTAEWAATAPVLRRFADGTHLTERLRDHLRGLSRASAHTVGDRSRETTTHFAWCLRDEPGEEFTLWLHEYKPQAQWRAGYADSVHNHRYHLCTALVRGAYAHEQHSVTLDPATGLVTTAAPHDRAIWRAGHVGNLLASQFHRIPWAADDTLTFVVKSRPVAGSSLSYDPETGIGQRHAPVESRLDDLINGL